ncbi:diguanylate cyclase [Acuticoccus sp. MNP-M23]|uniref:putative bifunctional diguanylate cyclase/phosphodiesterase n=1 Tax=Acuticoccus sp. MNP-M23 TaxID=3072793 RepID=UPI0028153EC1|nr:diguanylate cyclase [Acuticoccus sp. MNP-M23]WMS44375.1 diguanylate cyclase [Acuticoccus sp. MNP-M23]
MLVKDVPGLEKQAAMTAEYRETKLLDLTRAAVAAEGAALIRSSGKRVITSGTAGSTELDGRWLETLLSSSAQSKDSIVRGADDWSVFVDDSGSQPTILLLKWIDARTQSRVSIEQSVETLFNTLRTLGELTVAKQAAARSDTVIRGLEMMAEIGLWQYNFSSETTTWSDVTYQIHGVERGSFTPSMEASLDFFPEEVRGLVRNNINQAIEHGTGFSFVLPFRRADGELRTVRSVGNVIKGEGGEDQLFGIFQDITDVKEAELRLWWTANHDALTGLPNRMLFQERLDSAIGVAQRQAKSVGLILIDLDHFKSINDVYGHEAGDRVLKTVADRLSAQLRQGDTLARLGGDEFAIIVSDLSTAEDLSRPLERLLLAAEIDFNYRNIPIPVKLSMGAAVFPRDAENERELYRNADIALFRTKEEADERGTIYDPSHGAEREGRESQFRRIREAIAAGAIAPYFQPVFDLRTGRVASVEVLARWRDEADQILSATMLKPAFEDADLAPQLGLLILQHLQAKWSTLDEPTRKRVPLCLNLSPREMHNLTYMEALKRFVEESSTDGTELVLELKQNPLRLLPSHVAPTFERMLKENVTFGFDSLAAGFEALVESASLRVSQIKANKATLTHPNVEERAAAIIGGMIETCGQLGIQLVATEIETEGELKRLRSLGYMLGQGFYFCRAMDFEALTEMLQNEGSDRPSGNINAMA